MPPGAVPGGTGESGQPEDATAGTESGSGAEAGSQSGSSSGDTWETGLPGSGDGWETSNQIPGVGTNPIPPMPSERGKPPGDGSETGGRAGDKELDDALEDFDGGILAERDVIRARSNEAASNAGIPASGTSTQLPGGSDGTSSTTSADVASAPRGIPAQRSAPPAPKAGAAGKIPEDIPDAKDDDIIARQLREAAMNESDPELREKLWEEYRRYKGA